MSRAAHIAWDWTPEHCAWVPELGRWSPECGLPELPGYVEVATAGMQPDEAYEFWREAVFCHFEAEGNQRAPRLAFDARVRGLVSASGEFYDYVSDPVSGRRTAAHRRADDGEGVDIGLVLAGRWCQEQEGDKATASGPGEFFCFDAARSSRIAWDRYHGLQLTLRRPVLEAALGRSVPSASEIAGAVAGTPVALLLRDQLRLLAGGMQTFPAPARAQMLDQATELALFALRASAIGCRDNSEFSSRQGLLVAALRYIERHFADPDLDTAQIAKALRCSRATLYRAFAAGGLTVAGSIRERRLLRVRQCLGRMPPGSTIGEIAACCGFIERRSFNRLFLERFGVRPGEVAASS